MKNLWPNDIAKVANRTPVTILKEQAAFLGERTKNIVTAEVAPIESHLYEKDFAYRFYIVAPALQNYHYSLFTVGHPVELYPVTFYIDPEIGKEIGAFDQRNILAFSDDPSGWQIEVADEHTFLAVLEKIFESQKTRRVIASILGQSTQDLYRAE